MTVNRQMALWCRFGHPMTDENTYLSRSGEPRCRTCLRRHLASMRRWHHRASTATGVAGKEKP